jgi:hypothetical protein
MIARIHFEKLLSGSENLPCYCIRGVAFGIFT